jgi:hypothetical protein
MNPKQKALPFHRHVLNAASKMPEELAAEWLRRHGLLGFADTEALPSSVRDALKAQRSTQRALNTLIVWKFQEIVDALEGIPVCALKGVHLLELLYSEDWGIRPLMDLDLLIPVEAVDDAVHVLTRELGFVEDSDSYRLRFRSHHRLLKSPELNLELHYKLAIKHGRRSDWNVVQPVQVVLHERNVHVLKKEVLFVHLVSHFVKHGPYACLKWAEDIVRLLDLGLNWEQVVTESRQLGAHRSLAAGLRMIARVCDETDLFAGVMETSPFDGLLIRLNEQLFWRESCLSGVKGGSPPSRFQRGAVALLLSDSWVDAFKFIMLKRPVA